MEQTSWGSDQNVHLPYTLLFLLNVLSSNYQASAESVPLTNLP
jgi:hypothetical protein